MAIDVEVVAVGDGLARVDRDDDGLRPASHRITYLLPVRADDSRAAVEQHTRLRRVRPGGCAVCGPQPCPHGRVRVVAFCERVQVAYGACG